MSSALQVPQQVVDTEAVDLLPKAPAPAPRRAGPLALVACLLVAACAAAVLFSRKQRTSKEEGFTGLAISTVFTELAEAAAAGGDTIKIVDPTAVEIGDMLVIGADTDDKEWIRVAEIEGDILTLGVPLSNDHAIGAKVSSTTHTVGDNATSLEKPYNLTVPLGLEASAGDMQITLKDYCDQFEKGDEIKVEDEYNLIKNITLNDDGSCQLDLAYPLSADHTTESFLTMRVAEPPPEPATMTTTEAPTETTTKPTTKKTTTKKETTTTKKAQKLNIASAKDDKKSACGGLPRVGLAVLIATCGAGASWA